MIVGIDLHNIRDGGGMNYVGNLLDAANPTRHGFERIHLFGATERLTTLPERPFIEKHALPGLSGRLLHRLKSAMFEIPRKSRELGCDVVFFPGGLSFGRFHPYAAISRNILPFRPDLWSLYPYYSLEHWRLRILKMLNARTFAKADGMIFLTESARKTVTPFLPNLPKRVSVVPHGVNATRFKPVASRRPPSPEGPIRLVYPSRLEPYKHQVEVLRAGAEIREMHPGLTITFVGPANPAYRMQFEEECRRLDPEGNFVNYLGIVPNEDLPALYARHDALVFATSCENLPNILIEAMSSGIPIISSDASPMPDIAGDSALYFDPASARSIAGAIKALLSDWDAAMKRSIDGIARAQTYSWERCADQTFALLAEATGAADGTRGNSE